MPRRRAGELLSLELQILETGLALQAAHERFHGFQLAGHLAADARSPRALTAHGTLYKALSRMADSGLLEAAWEDSAIAQESGRPRRRLYRVTPDGAVALAAARAAHPTPAGFPTAASAPAGGAA